MSSIGTLPGFIQTVLTSALQSTGLTSKTTTPNPGPASVSSVAQQPDSGQLSPFAQMVSTLQQLQQSDPTKYQQVTQQIATNLQTAAQTAQATGNTTAATQLNQLATDFTTASKTGQLPNFQDLAKAAGGHHHHHHGSAADSDGSASSGTSASTTSSSGINSSQNLNQLLSSLQANGTQDNSLNPSKIILDTLSNAGINLS